MSFGTSRSRSVSCFTNYVGALWWMTIVPWVVSVHGFFPHPHLHQPPPPLLLLLRCPISPTAAAAAAAASTSRSSSPLWSTVTSVVDDSVVDDGTTTTSTSHTTTKKKKKKNMTGVILPGQCFRTTRPGELSVASCNLLAPLYHSLAIDDTDGGARDAFAQEDRLHRLPLAIQMAKQPNADILLLQEVEGGTPEHELRLKELLAEPLLPSGDGDGDGDGNPGYDSYLWAPLLPNRPDHIVGLCLAWRSNKHTLLASDCYKRGMIGQFQEIMDEDEEAVNVVVDGGGGGIFAVANVHLPARPSNILGRLVTMSRTIQKLASFDVPHRHAAHALDGCLLVGGDFNCEPNSVTTQLLTTGKSHYGNIRDRNYKANLSKASASRMAHGYRFHDVYDGSGGVKGGNGSGGGSGSGGGGGGNELSLRQVYAPVTVSLKGRGPGIMDQLFVAQQATPPPASSIRRTLSSPDNSVEAKLVKLLNPRKGTAATGRRQARREKATRMRRSSRKERQASSSNDSRGSSSGRHRPAFLQVESILATVAGSDDHERLELIHQGLPNVEAGFPSDHLPIGALFIPSMVESVWVDEETEQEKEKEDMEGASSSIFASSSSPASASSSKSGREEDTSMEVSSTASGASGATGGGGGVTQSVQRRRAKGIESWSIRRRHNVVLRCLAEWIEEKVTRRNSRSSSGSSNGDASGGLSGTIQGVIRDVPLYKNPWTSGISSLAKKSRAPDIVARIGQTLVVIEVTVVNASKTESVRQQKQDKYSDLPERLSLSLAVQEAGLQVAPPLVVVLEETGRIPDATRADIEQLSAWMHPDDADVAQMEAQRCCQRLQAMFTKTM